MILSKMKLPIHYEMPGAVRKLHYGPDFDAQGIAKGMNTLWKRFGFWTDTMSAFIYDAEALIEWFDAGGIESNFELPFLYNELLFRMQRFIGSYNYKAARNTLFGEFLKLPVQRVAYRGKQVRIWGDPKGAVAFFEALRLGTREPGVDDDEEYPEDEAEKQDASSPPEPDDEQLNHEAAKPVDPDGIYTNDALELLALLQQAGKDPPGGGGGGTGPPNTS